MSKIKKIILCILVLCVLITPCVSAYEVDTAFGDVHFKNMVIMIYNQDKTPYAEKKCGVEKAYKSVFPNTAIARYIITDNSPVSTSAFGLSFELASQPVNTYKYTVAFSIYFPYSTDNGKRQPVLSGAEFTYRKADGTVITKGSVSQAPNVKNGSLTYYGLTFKMTTNCVGGGYFRTWNNITGVATNEYPLVIDNFNFTKSDTSQEMEEKKADNQGKKSVKEVDNAIPNKSDGFISAVSSLVSSMSYSGTECIWKLPEIKLPQIGKLVDEKVLSTEKDINMTEWVDKIPIAVLTIIRALGTIALIVYCFKELYGIISYCLTLNSKGDSNE